MEDNKRTKDEIEKSIKRNEEFLDEPINKVSKFIFHLFIPMQFTKDTILHYAAYKQNNELIEYLINKGAKLNLRNNVFYSSNYSFI